MRCIFDAGDGESWKSIGLVLTNRNIIYFKQKSIIITLQKENVLQLGHVPILQSGKNVKKQQFNQMNIRH